MSYFSNEIPPDLEEKLNKKSKKKNEVKSDIPLPQANNEPKEIKNIFDYSKNFIPKQTAILERKQKALVKKIASHDETLEKLKEQLQEVINELAIIKNITQFK